MLCIMSFALATAGLSGCKPLPPVVQFHDIGISRLSSSSLDLVFEFKVYNPNAFGIDMVGLTYQVRTGDSVAAAGQAQQPYVRLNANDSATVRAPVSVDYLKLVQAARTLKRGGDIPYEFTGDATFLVMGMKVRRQMTHRGTIHAINMPTCRFRTIRWGRDSRDTVELVLDVDNPSEYDLAELTIHGSFKLGDEALLAVDTALAIPARQTTQLVLPVKIGLATAARLLATGLDGQKFSFEGDVHLNPTPSLREMLLKKGSK